MADLFADDLPPPTPEDTVAEDAPLADRLRPRTLDDVVGQEHLTGPEGAIGRMVAAGKLSSMILWGPPGTGKTSTSRLLAKAVGMRFAAVSAVFSGVADLRKAFAEAEVAAKAGQRTLLFVDEIHRFNRAQQDGFLPFVERGTVTLVGATTENPSFALNAALLSRAQVLVLNRLDAGALSSLLDKAEALEGPLPLESAARDALIATADGDGRFLLNQAETLYAAKIEEPLSPAALGTFLQRRMAVYDKDRDGHYNLISAFHKSVRGSDPQAALYYMARMLVAGEEPLYILRRLAAIASEDIGLADPQAMAQVMAAKQSFEFLGLPEGELPLAQAVIYCASAPKSNASYLAKAAAMTLARETGSVPPPMNILNAPTAMMKDLGYGAAYHYDHDQPDAFSGDDYWPESVPPQEFYQPNERGFERDLKKRLEWWQRKRLERRGG
ncbi:replication-associated recombination protein A [Novosphingobium profundi]|uniref:replication-associated recombination protein A n=1 Tax=Novosphingobium profundi TaxID=1774954 RepID=UPI001BDB56BF|nr:replication-associated recombination protein A [Novosphingobium profundi]MBT0666761.1 replication-associated recombination protein A [Novosphingobium profundi]